MDPDTLTSRLLKQQDLPGDGDVVINQQSPFHRPNRCTINLAAIETNLRMLQAKAPHTRLMPMIKALAYGMGSIPIAHFLASRGIDIFGVSSVEEGISLRQAGITQDIFVIHAAAYEVEHVIAWKLHPGVSDGATLEALAREAEKQQTVCSVHLHLDTGMGRFGCHPQEGLSLAQQIESCPSLHLEGLMTHLSCADNPQEDTFTLSQIQLFMNQRTTLERHGIVPDFYHIANSSGLLRFPISSCNMARIGLALYGISSSEAARKALDLQVAITLTSRIVHIHTCRAGDPVGYGKRFCAEYDGQKIGILPIGYHDGLHRHYSEKGCVWIRGHAAPIVGTICMDFMMVDITRIPDVCLGDTALVFGKDEDGNYVSPEEFAHSGKSITHELITCLGPRIERLFVYDH